jgi:site-specific DNA-methyltransferase (adenine-specific)
MMTSGMFTSNTPEWATPQWLFDELNKEFNFDLDPCSTHENAKCERHYTKEDDGLSKSWGGRVFCNPPYGKEIAKWVKKAYEESSHADVVMLIPARTDTKWFHNYIYGKAEIRFIKGRLRFGDGKTDAPFPSMIVIYKNKEK